MSGTPPAVLAPLASDPEPANAATALNATGAGSTPSRQDELRARALRPKDDGAAPAPELILGRRGDEAVGLAGDGSWRITAGGKTKAEGSVAVAMLYRALDDGAHPFEQLRTAGELDRVRDALRRAHRDSAPSGRADHEHKAVAAQARIASVHLLAELARAYLKQGEPAAAASTIEELEKRAPELEPHARDFVLEAVSRDPVLVTLERVRAIDARLYPQRPPASWYADGKLGVVMYVDGQAATVDNQLRWLEEDFASLFLGESGRELRKRRIKKGELTTWELSARLPGPEGKPIEVVITLVDRSRVTAFTGLDAPGVDLAASFGHSGYGRLMRDALAATPQADRELGFLSFECWGVGSYEEIKEKIPAAHYFTTRTDAQNQHHTRVFWATMAGVARRDGWAEIESSAREVLRDVWRAPAEYVGPHNRKILAPRLDRDHDGVADNVDSTFNVEVARVFSPVGVDPVSHDYAPHQLSGAALRQATTDLCRTLEYNDFVGRTPRAGLRLDGETFTPRGFFEPLPGDADTPFRFTVEEVEGKSRVAVAMSTRFAHASDRTIGMLLAMEAGKFLARELGLPARRGEAMGVAMLLKQVEQHRKTLPKEPLEEPALMWALVALRYGIPAVALADLESQAQGPLAAAGTAGTASGDFTPKAFAAVERLFADRGLLGFADRAPRAAGRPLVVATGGEEWAGDSDRRLDQALAAAGMVVTGSLEPSLVRLPGMFQRRADEGADDEALVELERYSRRPVSDRNGVLIVRQGERSRLLLAGYDGIVPTFTLLDVDLKGQQLEATRALPVGAHLPIDDLTPGEPGGVPKPELRTLVRGLAQRWRDAKPTLTKARLAVPAGKIVLGEPFAAAPDEQRYFRFELTGGKAPVITVRPNPHFAHASMRHLGTMLAHELASDLGSRGGWRAEQKAAVGLFLRGVAPMTEGSLVNVAQEHLIRARLGVASPLLDAAERLSLGELLEKTAKLDVRAEAADLRMIAGLAGKTAPRAGEPMADRERHWRELLASTPELAGFRLLGFEQPYAADPSGVAVLADEHGQGALLMLDIARQGTVRRSLLARTALSRMLVRGRELVHWIDGDDGGLPAGLVAQASKSAPLPLVNCDQLLADLREQQGFEGLEALFAGTFPSGTGQERAFRFGRTQGKKAALRIELSTAYAHMDPVVFRVRLAIELAQFMAAEQRLDRVQALGLCARALIAADALAGIPTDGALPTAAVIDALVAQYGLPAAFNVDSLEALAKDPRAVVLEGRAEWRDRVPQTEVAKRLAGLFGASIPAGAAGREALGRALAGCPELSGSQLLAFRHREQELRAIVQGGAGAGVVTVSLDEDGRVRQAWLVPVRDGSLSADGYDWLAPASGPLAHVDPTFTATAARLPGDAALVADIIRKADAALAHADVRLGPATAGVAAVAGKVQNGGRFAPGPGELEAFRFEWRRSAKGERELWVQLSDAFPEARPELGTLLSIELAFFLGREAGADDDAQVRAAVQLWRAVDPATPVWLTDRDQGAEVSAAVHFDLLRRRYPALANVSRDLLTDASAAVAPRLAVLEAAGPTSRIARVGRDLTSKQEIPPMRSAAGDLWFNNAVLQDRVRRLDGYEGAQLRAVVAARLPELLELMVQRPGSGPELILMRTDESGTFVGAAAVTLVSGDALVSQHLPRGVNYVAREVGTPGIFSRSPTAELAWVERLAVPAASVVYEDALATLPGLGVDRLRTGPPRVGGPGEASLFFFKELSEGGERVLEVRMNGRFIEAQKIPAPMLGWELGRYAAGRGPGMSEESVATLPLYGLYVGATSEGNEPTTALIAAAAYGLGPQISNQLASDVGRSVLGPMPFETFVRRYAPLLRGVVPRAVPEMPVTVTVPKEARLPARLASGRPNEAAVARAVHALPGLADATITSVEAMLLPSSGVVASVRVLTSGGAAGFLVVGEDEQGLVGRGIRYF
ncbi:MAG: hypothetical protein HY903_17825 [Deltaproteobacteria bacterium]|nr:hypothetical protein [Deltaproteobacteria bacterium]